MSCYYYYCCYYYVLYFKLQQKWCDKKLPLVYLPFDAVYAVSRYAQNREQQQQQQILLKIGK